MMKCNRILLLVAGACAALAWSAPSASAQVQRRQRAFHGVFGGPDASPNSQQQLDVNASLFGAYDDDVTAEQGLTQLATSAQDLSGVYSGLSLGMAYNRRLGRRASFGSSAGTSLRYYPSLEGHTLAPIGLQTGAGFSIGSDKKDSRNHVTFGGDLGFSPYYALSLLPSTAPPLDVGDLPPLPVDTIVDKREALTYGGGIQGERGLGARSSLSFNYGIHQMDFTGEDRRQSSISGGLYYRHNLSKNIGLRVGYDRMKSDFGRTNDAATNVVNNQIIAGIDFLKPISLTRRTTVNFSFGPSLIQQNQTRQIRIVGDFLLNHEMGRSWVARATYHRGVGMVAGLNAAVFSDGFGGTVEGLLSQRLEFGANASYSTGEFTMPGAPNNYGTYQASVRLRAALQQSTAVFVEYVAYRYDFDSRAFLPVGIPGRLFRQGVRTGLSLWLPLIR